MGALQDLYRLHRDRVAFLVVYIREAHPEDGWVLEENRREQITVRDPTTLDERAQMADTCAVRFGIPMTVLLDGPDDRVASQYGGWPDRLYLIDREGRVAFQGDEGPFGFEPELLGRAIEQELGRQS